MSFSVRRQPVRTSGRTTPVPHRCEGRQAAFGLLLSSNRIACAAGVAASVPDGGPGAPDRNGSPAPGPALFFFPVPQRESRCGPAGPRPHPRWPSSAGDRIGLDHRRLQLGRPGRRRAAPVRRPCHPDRFPARTAARQRQSTAKTIAHAGSRQAGPRGPTAILAVLAGTCGPQQTPFIASPKSGHKRP